VCVGVSNLQEEEAQEESAFVHRDPAKEGLKIKSLTLRKFSKSGNERRLRREITVASDLGVQRADNHRIWKNCKKLNGRWRHFERKCRSVDNRQICGSSMNLSALCPKEDFGIRRLEEQG
jgi:hypothetical protein